MSCQQMMTSASSAKNQDTCHGIVCAYAVLTVITMATSQLTAQTRYPHQVPHLDTEEGHQATTTKTDHILRIIIEMDTDTTPCPETHAQTHNTTITGTGTDIVSQDLIHATIATEVAADIIQEGDILDHTANPHATAHHAIDTLIHTASDATHHTGDLHNTEAFPETIARPDLTILPNTKHLQDQPTPTAGQNRAVKPINKLPSMTLHQNTIVLMIWIVIQRMIQTRRALS